MSKNRYVSISQHEFESFMQAHRFTCINDDQSKQELIFVRTWNKDSYLMKIYSSIVPSRASARSVGTDAIRVILFVLDGDKVQVAWKAPRVYRTKNWKDNLFQRIDEGLKRGRYNKNYQCKNCGAPLIGREGRAGNFYGCSNFSITGCRYTESV